MAANLLQQIADMRKSFIEEKLLDAQFVLLEELEDDNPNVVEEVFDMYFKDSAEIINLVDQELAKNLVDGVMLEKVQHQFKGSSLRVGANFVMVAINRLRAFLAEGNLEKCRFAFEQMCVQHRVLCDRLEQYFELKRQAQPVEIADDVEQPEGDGRVVEEKVDERGRGLYANKSALWFSH